MRAINHALTGALIGLTVDQPVIAMPVALLSHYVMDLIPHHGRKIAGAKENVWLKSRLFMLLLGLDALLCLILIIILIIVRPNHWLVACICAFLAAAPDLLSLNRYLKIKTGQPWQPNLYTRLVVKSQWFERPIGLAVELVWFVACIVLLTVLLA